MQTIKWNINYFEITYIKLEHIILLLNNSKRSNCTASGEKARILYIPLVILPIYMLWY